MWYETMDVESIQEYQKIIRTTYLWIERRARKNPDMAAFLRSWWDYQMSFALRGVTERTWQLTNRSKHGGKRWFALPDIPEEEEE